MEGTGLQGRAEGSLLSFQQRSIERRKRRREEVNEELYSRARYIKNISEGVSNVLANEVGMAALAS